MKIIAYIGKEIKIIMKIKSFNAKKPKKMLTKAVNGIYGEVMILSKQAVQVSISQIINTSVFLVISMVI